MTDLQTAWTEPELLATDPGLEPLVVAGYRCHGGLDADGRYHSPRTHGRGPAIAAWQEQHRADFGTDLLDIPLDTWPEPFPNVAQSRYLLEQGIREPTITNLTRIGTVEGFGAMIRGVCVPDRQRFFEESIAGTALEHLDRGLFEAHARDEAGYQDEAGHKEMWFAARDAAFDDPPTEDQTVVMLQRMGISGGGGAPDPEQVRRRMLEQRVFEDLDLALEMMIQRMVSLLLIEVSAHHTFSWAEALLADPDLVAGDGLAAEVVGYIRQDEQPHVEYLRTVLSEMRDRTFVGESGRRIAGTEVIGTLWDRALADSLGPRREQNHAVARREIEHALEGRRGRADILARFDELGSPTQALGGVR